MGLRAGTDPVRWIAHSAPGGRRQGRAGGGATAASTRGSGGFLIALGASLKDAVHPMGQRRAGNEQKREGHHGHVEVSKDKSVKATIGGIARDYVEIGADLGPFRADMPIEGTQ